MNISDIKNILIDWPAGTIIGGIFLICILILFGLILHGLFVAVDSWFLSKRQGYGRVVSKTFTPAHTQLLLIFNAATKTSMPHFINHPDDWSVCVEVNDMQDSISITKEFYDSLSKNSSVKVEYVHGRFSRNLYIKNIFSI